MPYRFSGSFWHELRSWRQGLGCLVSIIAASLGPQSFGVHAPNELQLKLEPDEHCN